MTLSNPNNAPIDQNNIEANDKRAQLDIGKFGGFADHPMDTVTKIAKNKTIAVTAAGYGVGFLTTAILLTGTPDNAIKFTECGMGGLVGGGLISYIVQEMDRRRKQFQIETSIERNFQRINEHPEQRPLLEAKLNYDLQTESILLREDSIGAVQPLLPWGNNSPSNPQQNTLPPATNPQNTLPPDPDTENPT